uniref:Uncharacterized protein n=1 Tax=Felis catus TaxID=9685 RepID=A0ABI7VXK8_FELCA
MISGTRSVDKLAQSREDTGLTANVRMRSSYNTSCRCYSRAGSAEVPQHHMVLQLKLQKHCNGMIDRSGLVRMVEAIRAPLIGGLEYMGRIKIFNCDSTLLASSASLQTTVKAPTRSPEKTKRDPVF